MVTTAPSFVQIRASGDRSWPNFGDPTSRASQIHLALQMCPAPTPCHPSSTSVSVAGVDAPHQAHPCRNWARMAADAVVPTSACRTEAVRSKDAFATWCVWRCCGAPLCHGRLDSRPRRLAEARRWRKSAPSGVMREALAASSRLESIGHSRSASGSPSSAIAYKPRPVLPPARRVEEALPGHLTTPSVMVLGPASTTPWSQIRPHLDRLRLEFDPNCPELGFQPGIGPNCPGNGHKFATLD